MGDLGQVVRRAGAAARPPAGPARTSIWPAHAPPPPRAGAGAPLHHHLLQRPPPGRAARRPPQRAGRGRGHRRRAAAGELVQGPPRLAGPRAAARHRGRAEAGRAPRPRRHLQPRARHRHGRRRPRHPGRVAGRGRRGLQRIGRAGHPVGEPSRGKLFPKHRGDLLEAAVVAQRMRDGLIEETRYPRNPLDVLAQQIVAMARSTSGRSTTSPRVVRRARQLRRAHRRGARPPCSTCWPAATRREEFAELRPRIVWDRVADRVRARAGAQRLAVTSGGTIPDRGLFGVFLPDGTRVGELDEEMVYESRPGETFLLGASTWRIEDITFERVIVTPAPGQPGKMPFWHGDRPGPPARARPGPRRVRPRGPRPGPGRRRVRGCVDRPRARRAGPPPTSSATSTSRPRPPASCPTTARSSSSASATRSATGGCACSRPFGTPVHAPWAMALEHRLAERCGMAVELMWSDDGIVLRLPEAVDELPVDELLDRPRRDRRARRRRAARARRCSRRASASARPGPCCCPGAGPTAAPRCGSSASGPPTCWRWRPSTPSFPILLEATRECLHDVFDLPALRTVLADLRARRIRLVTVDTPKASPFAQSLLFGWIAVYMYEGDAPLAERRAAALALDRDLLRELLGAEELRELIDPDVLADLELELQRLGRPPPGPLRRRGARPAAPPRRLSVAELDLRRGRRPAGAAAWVGALVAERRAIVVRVAGEERFAAAEDAARLRDALGARLPLGLPARLHRAGRAPARAPRRPLRPHPRPVPRPTRRLAGSASPVERVRRRPAGRSRPRAASCGASSGPTASSGSGATTTCCASCGGARWPRCARRSSRSSRPALARFLPAWQGIGVGPPRARRARRGASVVLQGAAAPGQRARGRRARRCGSRATGPADLDALCTSGDVVWVGAGALGASDGRVRLFFRDQVAAPGRGARRSPSRPTAPLHDGPARPPRRSAARPSGPTCCAAAAERHRRSSCSPPCGTWCGRARSPTTRSPRCGRSVGGATAPAGRRRRRAGRGARAGPGPGGSPGSGPPAGRRPLVAGRPAARAGPASPTEAAHARACSCSSATACSTREAALAEGVEGGFAGGVPRAQGARGAGPGPARLLRRRSRRGPVRPARRRRPAPRAPASPTPDDAPLVLAATDPAQPYGAALPWPEPPAAARPGSAGALVVLVDGELRGLARPAGPPPASPSRPAAAATATTRGCDALVDAGEGRPGAQPGGAQDRRRARRRTSPLAPALRAAGLRRRLPGARAAGLSTAVAPTGERDGRRPRPAGPILGTMPEGDTIHRTAAALRTAVLGKPLTAFEAPRLDRHCGRRSAPSSSASRARASTSRSASTTACVLHTHMRMTGSWHLYRAGEQWRKSTRQARVIIEVPGWQAVCFSAPVVRTYRAGEFVPNPRLAELGPDLCRPDADLDECVARIDRFCEPEHHRRRGAARPAHRLRRRQRLQVRGAVGRASCTRSPRSAPSLPEQREALLVDRRPSCCAPTSTARSGSPCPACPAGSAVYGRHEKPCFRCGTPDRGRQARRAGPRHLLVPGLPAVPAALAASHEPGELDGEPTSVRRRRVATAGRGRRTTATTSLARRTDRRPTTGGAGRASRPAATAVTEGAADDRIDGEAAGLSRRP